MSASSMSPPAMGGGDKDEMSSSPEEPGPTTRVLSENATAQQSVLAPWLRATYECDDSVSLPRQLLYDHYTEFCAERHLDPLNSALFGKVIHQVFPFIRTRRLGERGHSRYYYQGIRVRANSPLAGRPDVLQSARHGNRRGAGMSPPTLAADSKQRTQSPPLQSRPVATATTLMSRTFSPQSMAVRAQGGSAQVNQSQNQANQANQQHLLQQQVSQMQQQLLQQQMHSQHQQMVPASGSPHISPLVSPRVSLQGTSHLPPQISSPLSPHAPHVSSPLSPRVPHQSPHVTPQSHHTAAHVATHSRTSLLSESEFEGLFGESCRDVALELHADRFAKVFEAATAFWGTHGERLVKLPLATVTQFVYLQRLSTYSSYIRGVFPEHFGSMSEVSRRVLREFGRNVVTGMQGAFQAMENKPPIQVVIAEVRAVERLARALLWGTHLDHLAQAVREILLNDEQVDQMSVDWQGLDVGQVLRESADVCNVAAPQVGRVLRKVQEALYAHTRFEEWLSLVNAIVLHSLPSVHMSIDVGRHLLLCCSYVSTMVIRDLAMRSVSSFGHFQLSRILFSDLLLHFVSCRFPKHIPGPHGEVLHPYMFSIAESVMYQE